MTLVKSILKLVVIGVPAVLVIKSKIPTLTELMNVPLAEALMLIMSFAMEIVLFACIILFIVALADFAWQKYDMTQKMKMTKEEVKQERKDQEGNDQVKGEIRRRGIENARASIQAAIPESDVVVTNPSHYAIALKYQPGDPAPIVLAKGIDYKAQYIKELAREHNIAMVEDKPLARTLYASCKVGSCIPIELFQAVARILAYVYRTRGGKSSQPRA